MLALALTAALALSVPGTLDRSFGHDGRVITPAGGIGTIAGVEALPHGQVLLVATIDYRKVVLIRYRRNGSIAKRTSVQFDRQVATGDTLLDSRGRLLVAGSLRRAGSFGHDALLLRFDRAGHLDPTLDGDGISLTSFGAPEGAAADAIALAPDGSIVMAATLPRSPYSDVGLTRLHPDGTVDTSFGQQGFVRRAPRSYLEHLFPDALAVLPDGRIAVVVVGDYGKGGATSLLRLLENGSPDPAFDPVGLTLPGEPFIEDLAQAPSTGRLIAGGLRQIPSASEDYAPQVSALDPAAAQPAWQTTFKVRRPDGWAYLNRVAVDRRGRPLALGSSQWTSRNVPLGEPNDRSEMYVARLRAKGGLDRCFGKRGIARIRFPGTLSIATAMATARDGSIVIAGTHGYPDQKVAHRFELARLRGGNCPRR